jgi:hypothetical protein
MNGQMVDFAPRRTAMSAAYQQYVIVSLLPPEDGRFQYRIKCKSQNFERVAKESELSHPGVEEHRLLRAWRPSCEPLHVEGQFMGRRKPTARLEFVLFNVLYEDGSKSSNGRVTRSVLGTRGRQSSPDRHRGSGSGDRATIGTCQATNQIHLQSGWRIRDFISHPPAIRTWAGTVAPSMLSLASAMERSEISGTGWSFWLASAHNKSRGLPLGL